MTAAPKYIVEQGGGNPRILSRTDEGVYRVLTHGAGDRTTDDLVELCRLGNEALGLTA